MSDSNRKTIAAYDTYAETYARKTVDGRTPTGSDALDRFIAAAGPGARVLEIGSGPGWDADAMEAAGLSVRRTDISEGFIAVQAERGKVVERLNLIDDDLGGPWDGLVVLYVIQHIEADMTAGVLARMARALRPGGVLLMSFQEGDETFTEHGASGDYHIVRRPRDAMVGDMARTGLEVVWDRRDEDSEGPWVTVIARRS